MRRALLAVLPLWLASATAVAAQPTEPAQVIAAFQTALNAGNVEAAVALFAEDAVVTLQPPLNQTYRGKAAIRGWFEHLVAVHFHGEVVSPPQTMGERVRYLARVTAHDEFRQLGVLPLEVPVEATFRAGKIQSYTVGLTPESAAKLTAALAAQPPAAAAGPMRQLPRQPVGLPRTGDGAPRLGLAGLVLVGASLVAGGRSLRRRTQRAPTPFPNRVRRDSGEAARGDHHGTAG